MEDILKKLLEKYSELQAYGDEQGNKIDRQIMGDKYVDNNEGPSPTGLASDMAGSTAGITRAEQELGRYAGKLANMDAAARAKLSKNDILPRGTNYEELKPSKDLFNKKFEAIEDYSLIDKMDTPQKIVPSDDIETAGKKAYNSMRYTKHGYDETLRNSTEELNALKARAAIEDAANKKAQNSIRYRENEEAKDSLQKSKDFNALKDYLKGLK